MMPVLLLPLLLLLGVGLITVAEVTKALQAYRLITLVLLASAYRLITVAEVTKALQAKEEEKTRRAQQQLLQQVVQTKHAGGRTGSGDDS